MPEKIHIFIQKKEESILILSHKNNNMSTANKNLSDYNIAAMPDATPYRFGIVVAEWNTEVTSKLLQGAYNTLQRHGAADENIIVVHVPGSFELTIGASTLLSQKLVDAVIVLGVVIQGETRHFDFICQGVTQGVTQLNIQYNKPVIFGLLTTDNMQQAIDRAGGKHGNKGDEAAVAAIQMAHMQYQIAELNKD